MAWPREGETITGSATPSLTADAQTEREEDNRRSRNPICAEFRVVIEQQQMGLEILRDGSLWTKTSITERPIRKFEIL